MPPTATLIALLLLLVTGSTVAEEPQPEARVRVEIDGIDGALLRNARMLLGIEQQRDHPRLSEGRIRRLHAKAPEEIQRALEAFGHYHARVDGELIQEGDLWIARYRVDPGPPVMVEAVNLELLGEGARDPAFLALRDAFPLAAAQALEHARYEEGKTALLRLAAQRGYFEARLDRHEVEVDLDSLRAVVRLSLDTGPRYRFGPVSFSDTVLRSSRLERYLRFKEGDPYHAAALLELQNALNDSDIFAQVEVEPRPEQAVAGYVPIEVRLAAHKKHKYSAGVGFGTDSGARGRLAWENRYFNDRGHRVNADLRLAQRRRSLASHYIIPLKDPRNDSLAFRAALLDEDTESRDSQILQLGAAHTTSRWGWRETLSLTYQVERSEIARERETSQLLYPGAGWTRIIADDPVYTRQGLRLGLDLRGAYEDLLSDVSFAQLRVNAKWITSPWERGRFISRGDFGLTAVEDIDDLPASLRFYAGGDNSIRGYDLDALGPRNRDGRVIGGKYLVVGSLEYEHRILDRWSLAVFYDVGNAINDLSDDLEYGAGIGLRWHSPVGLVRVDLASGLSQPDNPIRLHVNIGPDL